METAGEPPKFGLKLPLNHVYPLQSKQVITKRPKQILSMMPITARYFKYYLDTKKVKKKPIMDYVNMIKAQRMYGCPIGGIGGGTIGRGFKGEFCRFQLYPGIYEYITVPECQFIVNIKNADNETIFQSVLSTYDKPKKAPPTWKWNLDGADCEYTGLYPRAWTTYDLSKHGVKLVCRQISPVIPHNYKDSSLPCAVFVFSAENVCTEHRNVSITFTWTKIPVGPKKKKEEKLDLERYSEEHTCGVTLEQTIADTPCTFTIAKRKDEKETIHEGYCLWNAAKTSSYVWQCLDTDGRLVPDPSLTPAPPKIGEASGDKKPDPKPQGANEKIKKIYECDSIALSSNLSLAPGGVATSEFCLVWDMPIVKYKRDNKINRRYYTRYFGADGIAGTSIAAYALKNYKNWEKQIAEWQDPILTNSNIPDWLKSALMNELYYVADGGTIWFDVQDQVDRLDPRHEFGLFGYLEGHEYRMYNTYDVHFYASFALAQLWPNLQVVLQYMYGDSIRFESKKCRTSLYDGKVCKYKIKDSIPHDMGDPEGIPFTNINAYNIHDVSEWRDLNLKFILQVCRDYQQLRGHSAPFPHHRYRSMAFIDDVRDGTEDDLYTRATEQADLPPALAESAPSTEHSSPVAQVDKPTNVGHILDLLYRNVDTKIEEDVKQEPKEPAAAVWDSKQYLADMYPACITLLRKCQAWDQDGDGLIENTGSPDQTFDAWVMTGPSAYCCGLWLAAISGVRNMARLLGKEEDERELGQLLEQAAGSFEEKLWNGSFYKFDTKPSNKNVVMADQLAGLWYLRSFGASATDQVYPDINVKKTLRTIYENNVLRFRGGKMGAVNGYITGSPGKIDTSSIQSEEMWTGVTYALASLMLYEGMHEEAFATAGGMYEKLVQMGLSFETPEALYESGNHRSVGYMRPLSVWSMYQAIVARPPPAAGKPHANGQANGHMPKENHTNSDL